MSYNKHILVLIGCCLITYQLNAQLSGSDKVAKFTVTCTNYSIFPLDNFLFVGYHNKIMIKSSTKDKPYEVRLTNGNITKTTTDSIFIIDGLSPVNTLLSIYEKTKDGKSRLVFNKPYTFIPRPLVKISGVKSDSAISQLILAAGIFYADFKSLGKIRVSSFKMDLFEKGDFSEDSSSTGRLTKRMLKYIGSLKPGSLIYFKDLKFMTGDGIAKTEPIFRVFVVDEINPLKFGF